MQFSLQQTNWIFAKRVIYFWNNLPNQIKNSNNETKKKKD